MPGHAVWNGDVPKNLNVLNNTFWKNPVVGAAAANSGRCGGGCYGKGHVELKTVDEAVFDANDYSGYAGGFTITSRNQPYEDASGSNPWATVTNVVFKNSRWRGEQRPGKGAIIGIQLNDNNATTEQGHHVTFENFLFENLWSPILLIGGSPDVTFRNVTALGGVNPEEEPMIGAHSQANPRFVLQNNILQHNEYGITSSVGGSVAAGFPAYVMVGNVVLDNRRQAKKNSDGSLSQYYPSTNQFPQTFAEIKLVNWSLDPSSPFKAKATDGKDPGVDVSKIGLPDLYQHRHRVGCALRYSRAVPRFREMCVLRILSTIWPHEQNQTNSAQTTAQII